MYNNFAICYRHDHSWSNPILLSFKPLVDTLWQFMVAPFMLRVTFGLLSTHTEYVNEALNGYVLKIRTIVSFCKTRECNHQLMLLHRVLTPPHGRFSVHLESGSCFRTSARQSMCGYYSLYRRICIVRD